MKSKKRNFKKLKEEKGITLVALVITIIILIILATVAINFAFGNNGLINRAEDAKIETEKANIKERLSMAIIDIKIEELANGREMTIDTIIEKLPSRVENTTVEKDEEGAKGISNGYNFTIDSEYNVTVGEKGQDVVEDVKVTDIILDQSNIVLSVDETSQINATVEPSNATNKTLKWTSDNEDIATVDNGMITAKKIGTTTITVEAQDGSGIKKTCEVRVEEVLKDIAKPGNYVKYDTGISEIGENGIITFRVLYNDETNGLQIISDGTVEDLALGGDTWATAMDSYNNAISTLNQRAEKYATSSPYAIDGRCVGSVPTVDADGKFNAKNTENVGPADLQFTTSVEGANNLKAEDTNYTADKAAMEAADLMGINSWYWLASREPTSSSTNFGCYVRIVYIGGGMGSEGLCSVRSDNSTNSNYTREIGLRPCISLNTNVKVVGGGDGSSETEAFELGL